MAPIVTGYYRYTDIWFKWPEVLPAEYRDPLKGVIAHDALVHPQNPLHPDVAGVTLYQGIFHDGEARLLFSSAQVDYVRYWLKAMNLTKELIPLPYSECLLTEAEFSAVSPVQFMTGGDLRVATKNIDKNNKRLKGSNVGLTQRRAVFERVRQMWSSKVGSWLAVDFEEWERDHTVVTEFGWSSFRYEEGTEVEEQGHFTVAEARSLRNGQYITDVREHYIFGESQEVSKADLKRKLKDLISGMPRPLFLVFHDPSQDIKTLKRLQAPIETAVLDIPDKTPEDGIFIVDTAVLFAALCGEATGTRGLGQMCNQLQVFVKYLPNPGDESWLHNAGNDAHYTLLALKEMAGGEPLDMQREQRWPNRTGLPEAKLQVKFEDYEEYSDYEDQEGVMGGYDSRTGALVDAVQ
ncbi:hypothetical protein FB45DRAFT_904238 [Roridomyces roridus]|uniref:Gfd2/YDR514C-like C-terminal domain-containing protein n=1 Tax=Roridomyces roridus TaxID=1738132 RepID=A0AAD7C4J1_9AGAR|nr:hypothetical protein FB45DRAFT_904238 [Roridomyces roridus]